MPSTNHFSQDDAQSVAEAWLARFVEAVGRVDCGAVADCVQEDGWFRDLLTFTWDFRSIHGRENISSYLKNTLGEAEITDVRLDGGFSPRIDHFGPNRIVVDAALKFETSKALGKGFVRIAFHDDRTEKPEALALFMTIIDWKGHEEVDHESGIYEGHTVSWRDVRAQRRKEIEETPDVVIGALAVSVMNSTISLPRTIYSIVGAGQTGLQLAARFRQMNIKAIIIEKNDRVGDNWRKHYPTLTLHTPRQYNSCTFPRPSRCLLTTALRRLIFSFFFCSFVLSFPQQHAQIHSQRLARHMARAVRIRARSRHLDSIVHGTDADIRRRDANLGLDCKQAWRADPPPASTHCDCNQHARRTQHAC